MKKLVAVIGPTASGKTHLGVRLAYKFNGEILSADSRQVYKKLDIGTGKDLDEYRINNTMVRYHLIDVVDVEEEYNLFRYKTDFISSFNDIVSRERLPVMIGGSGLYISSIIQDYKLKKWESTIDQFKELNKHNELTPGDNKQIKELLSLAAKGDVEFNADSCVIGVRFERAELKKRITERLIQRLESGMIDEIRSLVDNNVSAQRLLTLGLEYRYITLHVLGELSYNDMFQKLNSSIHSFAKRQMTWFRKMEREGVKINWVEKGDLEQSSAIIENFLQS
jgi:tRNA dimethylallyltransferase